VGERSRKTWKVTSIRERDSILGGDAKLEAAIRDACAEREPAAIAILASPVVAINNDDIESVAAQTREERGIPVLFIRTDGFRSKIASTGVDLVVHALLREILGRENRSSTDGVILLTVSETAEDVVAMGELIRELGSDWLPFPQFASVADWSRVASSKQVVSLDPSESEYAGTMLHERAGGALVMTDAPIGAAATAQWVARVAASIGRPGAADEVASRHKFVVERARDRLAQHRGARLYINLPAGKAFSFVQLAREFGLVVVGIQVPSLGSQDGSRLERLAAEQPELPILVGEGQVFEEVNSLLRLRPDLYVCQGNAAVHALRLGIPVLDVLNIPVLGYTGLQRVADAIDRRLSNPALARFLSNGEGSRYSAQSLAKSTHWFIKREVK
jgi:nitrogenase molybdenum-iron protein alpha/beta subunit